MRDVVLVYVCVCVWGGQLACSFLPAAKPSGPRTVRVVVVVVVGGGAV